MCILPQCYSLNFCIFLLFIESDNYFAIFCAQSCGGEQKRSSEVNAHLSQLSVEEKVRDFSERIDVHYRHLYLWLYKCYTYIWLLIR